jgi:hypothetical protein
MKIIVKVGPTSQRDVKRFDSSSNPATVALAAKKMTLNAAQERANLIAREKTVERLGAVQDDVRNDIEIYAKQMLNFFFKLKSHPDGKTPLRIQMPHFEREEAFKSAFTSLGVANPDLTLTWPALSTHTIKNKKGSTVYFVHSGDLLDRLVSEFAPFLRNVMAPTVSFVAADDDSKVGKVQISVLTAKKGQNLSNLRFLKPPAGNAGSLNSLLGLGGDDRSLIARYVDAEVADKLTNFGRPQKRELVSPIIGYYVLSRFPTVVANSLSKHFKLGKI